MRRALGVALVLLGVLVGGGAAGGLLWSEHRTAAAQERLLADLPAAPSVVPGPEAPVARPVAAGEPLAALEVPRFGRDWRWALLEGAEEEVLVDGPGHYAGTPLPGARGNVAVAAHRAGHGSPFLDFDRLQVGDEVRLTQGDLRWVYRLTTAPRLVEADADWVLEDLPGRSLTLTTCWPRYGSSKRLFVRAKLAAVESDGRVVWEAGRTAAS